MGAVWWFEGGEMGSREKADALFLYELEKEAQGYLGV